MLKFNFIDIDFVRAFVDGQLQVNFFLTSDIQNENLNRIRIVTTDPFFDLEHYPSVYDDQVPLNTPWFVEFHLNADYGYAHKLGYKGGVHLRVYNLDNDELIFDEIIWMFKKYLPLRQNSTSIPHHIKRIFAIGDSHIWHNYGGRNFTTANGYPIIKYSVPSLTMHTFNSGNYMDFVDFLPIESGDYLLFNFGDCDLRNTFLKHATKYNKDVKEVIYETCQKYFRNLKAIATYYSSCEILLCTPNFPITEKVVNDVSHFVPVIGNEQERKSMYDFFVTLIKTQPYFQVIDCPTIYSQTEGLMDEANLEPNDIHISDYQHFVRELNDFIVAHEN